MSDDWDWPYTDGYTGPYYSDGKFQSSVFNGSAKPKNKLASLSRNHDSSYFVCGGDSNCNNDADLVYFRATRDMDFVPRVIGAMPLLWHNPVGYAAEVSGGRKINMGNSYSEGVNGAEMMAQIANEPSGSQKVANLPSAYNPYTKNALPASDSTPSMKSNPVTPRDTVDNLGPDSGSMNFWNGPRYLYRDKSNFRTRKLWGGFNTRGFRRSKKRNRIYLGQSS